MNDSSTDNTDTNHVWIVFIRVIRVIRGLIVFLILPVNLRKTNNHERIQVQLADLAERVRSGRLRPIVGAVRPLAEAPSAFTPGRRVSGKTIIRVTDEGNFHDRS